MEVSSHALSLKRVDGMRFAAGVFTNLTRDHLDFHEDMETYFQAKRRLFEMLPDDAPGVINVDDPRGEELVAVCRHPVTFAITHDADVTPGALSNSLDGVSFDLRTPRGTVAIQSKLVGRPNVYNILAAAATFVAMGLPLEAIAEGVRQLPGVPGRFEVVSAPGDEVTVVVDYAHTDDAKSAGNGAAVGSETADHGVWMRRRSRSHQAAPDGHGRGAPERCGRDHFR
jgi:UDP-N-acetylmuramoyl-L-alanyl-D-glutamate--2,6-diaminopimelate ligase